MGKKHIIIFRADGPLKNTYLTDKLEKLNSNEFKGVFIWYRKPWNFWHNARTFFGMISFLMLIIYTTF